MLVFCIVFRLALCEIKEHSVKKVFVGVMPNRWIPCLNSITHFACGFLKAWAYLKAPRWPLFYHAYLTQQYISSSIGSDPSDWRCHAQLLKWRLILTLWSRYPTFWRLTDPYSDWHMAFTYTNAISRHLWIVSQSTIFRLFSCYTTKSKPMHF